MFNFVLFALESTHALILCTFGWVLRYVHNVRVKEKLHLRGAAYPATGQPIAAVIIFFKKRFHC